MARVYLPGEGQALIIPDEIADDDERLKRAILRVNAGLVNVQITRGQDSEGKTVTITKQAATKGVATLERPLVDLLPALLPPPAPPSGPLAALLDAPAEVLASLALEWRIQDRERAAGGELSAEQYIELAPDILFAFEEVAERIQDGQQIVARLITAKPVPSRHVPAGF